MHIFPDLRGIRKPARRAGPSGAAGTRPALLSRPVVRGSHGIARACLFQANGTI
jgi:hypothetical protein